MTNVEASQGENLEISTTYDVRRPGERGFRRPVAPVGVQPCAGSRARGTFGVFLAARRERKRREALAGHEARLVELSRSIEELERWHHEWCLMHDENYRTLHPRDWCEHDWCPKRECWGYRRYSRCTRFAETPTFRRSRSPQTQEGADEIITWSGHAIRITPDPDVDALGVTRDERRRATRRVADWGRDA